MAEAATPAAPSSPTRKKPLKLDIGHLTEKNVGTLKKLNTASFPVHYNEQFYTDLLKTLEYSRLGFYADILIGSVCCRLEDRKEGNDGKALYILTLSVLKAYQRRSIATQLVQWVIDHAQSDARQGDEVQEIFLHVQTSNASALRFYGGFGFEVTEKIENYYFNKIDPPDCYVLRKPVNGAKLTLPVLPVPELGAPKEDAKDDR